MANESRNQTVVLGFDALDFRYLDRFSDSLPNFEALRDRGVEAPLSSTFPPWTGSAWPSMYTGVGPSHHGVYDFFAIDGYPDEASLASYRDVRAPALWDYLTSVDEPSVVLNLPVTHPIDELRGVLVPGYLAPEDAPGHPPGIREELDEALSEPYTIYSDAETGTDPESKLTGYLDLIDRRTEAARHLLSTREWRLAVLQLQKTDAVFHNFDDESAFRAVYEAADRFLGAVLDAVDDSASVVVCSDHGMRRKRGYGVYVNEVLRRHGFVVPGDGGTGTSLSTVKSELTAEDAGADESTRAPFESLLSTVLRRTDLPLGRAYDLAERLGVADALSEYVPGAVREAASDGIDWRESTAYCRSGTRLGVRINVAGRDPAGVVPPERYDAVRDEVVEVLSSLRTPDGEPAFDFVVPREEIYDGPHAEAADDVLFKPAGMNNTVSTKLLGRRFVSVDVYDHGDTGVFVGAGPAFENARAPERFELTDVAPVVMGSMGLAVPERMTGRVPGGLLDGSVRRAAYDEVTSSAAADAMGEDERAAMTERLEDLGYL
jgi:predicted AlkP superfamily phosphohydrolase/phosphomutase